MSPAGAVTYHPQETGMLYNRKTGDGFERDQPSKRPSAIEETPANPAPSRKPSSGSPPRSVMDSWLTIRGDLQSEGEVQVDGQVHGDIRCASLTVGKDATVVGNITAEEVVVCGNVRGTIRANRVILRDNAHVHSHIFHKTLAIEEGACFDGRSCRCENPMSAEVVDLQAAVAEMKAAAAA
jgi:cytoskeletal protein CcmA (bactofilin family)